jgi:HAMP domain-containing protein
MPLPLAWLWPACNKMPEIIPKPKEKTPSGKIFLLSFSIALLIGVILSYFVLDFFQKKSLISLENLKTEVSQGKTTKEITFEKEIKSLEKKIKIFSQISEKHFLVTKFFEELEKLSHPRVWYSDLNLDIKGGKATISGVSDNFSSLGQQILIFENNPKILETNLSKISINRKGQIEFTLDLSLDPSIFK